MDENRRLMNALNAKLVRDALPIDSVAAQHEAGAALSSSTTTSAASTSVSITHIRREQRSDFDIAIEGAPCIP